MKPYKKLLVMAIILVAILILIAFQIEGTKLKDNIMNSESGNQYLNSSGSWYLTGSYVIDGNDGWATFASTYDWCSGSGTWADPYIIENVTFDGLNTGTCLTIQDTNKYFVIKNCSILNTPYTWDDEAGVKLINVKNGTFLRNNFKSNEYRGLYLQLYCNNITIKENFFIGVCYYDIYFVNNCSDNTILNNTFTNGNDNCIYLRNHCKNNNIVMNNLTDNWGGMYVYENCDYTNISKNSIENNYGGISISGSTNCTISQNYLNLIEGYSGGIYATNVPNAIIKENIIKNIEESGIHVNSDNVSIKENTVFNCDYGMDISGAYLNVSSNIMKGCGINLEPYGSPEEKRTINLEKSNSVNGKPVYYYNDKLYLKNSNFTNAGQIILVNCNHSIITGQEINNASIAISLHWCYNNSILGNLFDHNSEYGVFLFQSTKCNVSQNTVSKSRIGIDAYYLCDNTSLTENVCFNNEYGLMISYSSCGKISRNLAYNNLMTGIYLSNTQFTIASENFAWNNSESGISLVGWTYCINNTITKNTAFNNTNYGIYTEPGPPGDVFENNTISWNFVENNTAGIYVSAYSTYYDYNAGKLSKVIHNIAENNNEGGIIVVGDNNIASFNNITNNGYSLYGYYYGYGLEVSGDYNFISENLIQKNIGDGILVYGNFNNITDNYIRENEDTGLNLYYADYSRVIQNEILNNHHGIYSRGINNTIIYNIILNNTGIGMDLNDYQTSIIQHNTVANSNYGIRLLGNYQGCFDNKLTLNTIINNTYGIYLGSTYSGAICNRNNITMNILTDNIYGVYLFSDYRVKCRENNVIRNNIINSTYGIFIKSEGGYCDQNQISENYINGSYIGIYIEGNPTVYYTTKYGTADFNLINGNLISNNSYGIYLINTINDEILYNSILKNHYAMYLLNVNNSLISGNYIEFTLKVGVIINDTESNSNEIYLNYFKSNGRHAVDNSTLGSNHWNSTWVGNYWDDYLGLDANDDGIGDIPYDYIGGKAKSVDYFPIWDDGYDGSPIYINGDTNLIYGWDWISTLSWCKGTGTQLDPYIFENLIIFANDVGSGILIENTDLYFQIINCTIYNSGCEENNAGIRLFNAVNGFLINNTIKESGYAGILVLNSQYIEIKNNEILHASEIGICIDETTNVTVYLNKISLCNLGIFLLHSSKINVTFNSLTNCQTCIFDYGCTNIIYEGNSCPKEILIEIIDQSFSPELFWIKFKIFNNEGQSIDNALIIAWWDGEDFTSKVENLGDGFYSIQLSPIILNYGEDPILLNMTISAINYNNKYFETRIGVYKEELTGAIEANIDVDPNTLNDKSKGKWITVYIELPEGYDLNEIDLGSILLNNSLHIASSSPCEIGDYDGDGVPDLMVKFSLGEVQDMLAPGKNNIVITGELLDGTTFEGEDEIQFTINYNNENYTVLDNLINTSILSAGLICLVPVMKIIKKRK